MKTNKHGNLVKTGLEGNGFHGVCEHCGLAYTSDLGFNSWEGTTCIERTIVKKSDVPKDISSLAAFHGWVFVVVDGVGVYVKPYTKEVHTLEQIESRIKMLNHDR